MSRSIALSLVIAGMATFLWAANTPHSTGISIAILACMAGIMSVRPDMHILERVAWVVLLISFTILEVKAINLGDKQNADNIAAQTAAASEIAGLAKKNLLAVTGGDSYLYTVPLAISSRSPQMRSSMLLNIHNAGNEPLTNVTVSMAAIENDCSFGICPLSLRMGGDSINQLPLGTVAPQGVIRFPHCCPV